MFNPELIPNIVSKLVKDIGALDAHQKRRKRNPYQGSRNNPDVFYPAYNRIVQEREKTLVHSDGAIPKFLFEQNLLYETDQEKAYRERMFSDITRSGWLNAVSRMNKVINSRNYSVSWDSEKQKEYFDTLEFNHFIGLMSFISNYELEYKFKDPNAVKVHWPVLTESDTEQLQVKTEIYASNKVIWRSGDAIFILKHLTEKEATILLVDELNYYVIGISDRNKAKPTVTIEALYADGHGLDEAPWTYLRGRIKESEQGEYYESHFGPVIGLLNDALLDSSTLKVSKIRTAFPKDWTLVDSCDNPGCDDGQIFVSRDDEGNEIFRDCEVCKRKKDTVHRTIEVKLPKPGTLDNKSMPSAPYAGFVEQSYDGYKFLREEIEKQINHAWSSQNIDITNSQGQPDTATGRKIDREELHAFMIRIMNEVFDSIEFSYRIIGGLVFGDSYIHPEINRPFTFELRTETELTDEFITAVEKGIPVSQRAMIADEYEQTRFTVTSHKGEILKTAKSADELYYLSDREIQLGLSQKVYQKWQVYLHSTIINLIKELIEENKGWLSKRMPDRKKDLIEKAKERVPELEQTNQRDDIIRQIAGEATS